MTPSARSGPAGASGRSSSGSLLVCGTSSGAGKSVLVAGLCRALARRGRSVAPFKAQNMSLNSYVTRDGHEIGRAQAAQAFAAGVEPEVDMNPVLLKPGSDTSSQVIVRGRPVAEMSASDFWGAGRGQAQLLDVVVEAHRSLCDRFDAVICEGAGSPAEFNLRSSDIVNLGFARAAGVPTVVVSDIDRGGMFASLVGTLAVLDGADQALIAGWIVNRFRGDRSLLDPGLAQLGELTGRPTLGVLPFVRGIGLDGEDAIDLALLRGGPEALGDDVLRVVVVAVPRLSNHTDVDALAIEPGVVVRFADEPAHLADADLVVLPGTRATVADLAWMRERGIDAAVHRHAAAGGAILGICGGYQMLGERVVDDVESAAGEVRGLGLLPVTTRFGHRKILGRPVETLPDGSVVEAYEIHHGVVERTGGEPLLEGVPDGEGCRVGSIRGTIRHGLLEHDGVRRSLLAAVAAAAGRRFVVAPDVSFAAARQARADALGSLVADHLDLDAVERLLDEGVPLGMPTVTLGRSGAG